MSAANESYARLLAARRIVTPEEREETEKERKHDLQEARIRRKLQAVF